MILKQYCLGCLSHASYMIVDEVTRIAAVVDPRRDIDQYLQDADEHGVGEAAMDLVVGFRAWAASHVPVRDESSQAGNA